MRLNLKTAIENGNEIQDFDYKLHTFKPYKNRFPWLRSLCYLSNP